MKTTSTFLFIIAITFLFGHAESVKARRNKRKRNNNNHPAQVITLAPSPVPISRVSTLPTRPPSVLQSVRERLEELEYDVGTEYVDIINEVIAGVRIEDNIFGRDQGIENVVNRIRQIMDEGLDAEEVELEEDEDSEYDYNDSELIYTLILLLHLHIIYTLIHSYLNISYININLCQTKVTKKMSQ